MKIKTKLVLAVGLLFFLITILAVLGIRQVNLLAEDTRNILVANYLSLDYSRNMYKVLDHATIEKNDLDKFALYIERQGQNVTEIGEKELTENLSEHFAQLYKDPESPVYRENVRDDLNDIMKLNMDAIRRKSNTAENTAEKSVLWISLTSSFCFIIGFTLILNLPGYIANPIRDLTESIRQIAAKNYSQRVYFKGHDEFGTLAKSFNSMAEKLQEYSAANVSKLMMEKKRIETLINNMHDPVIGLDENHTILFANEEALKITGIKSENLVGRPAQEVSLTNDLVRSLTKDLVVANPHKAKEPLKIFADGKESYFEKDILPISIIPTGETDKKQIGSVIILRNITAYKELDFAKTNFIATVSHEFKTPIASMKMSLQLLENQSIGSLNEEQANLVAGIREDANRLLRTTGELLNITQVETGKTQIDIQPCDPAAILEDAILANKTLAGLKHIAFETTIPDTLPDILADREKTTWIISNLISNAIRYSYENSVIFLSARSDPKKVEIIVKDTGQGIAAGYKDKIFDKYFRVPGTQKEGTGLGLAISKEFIEAQGGAITVESELGSGSLFTVTLPVLLY